MGTALVVVVGIAWIVMGPGIMLMTIIGGICSMVRGDE